MANKHVECISFLIFKADFLTFFKIPIIATKYDISSLPTFVRCYI